MLQNWEVSGFGLTQQNRTRGGNYGEGENLRTFFLVLTGAFLFPKAPHHDPVVCLYVQQHRASIWVRGKEKSAFQESLDSVWCLLKVLFLAAQTEKKNPCTWQQCWLNPSRSFFRLKLKGCFWLVSLKAAGNGGEEQTDVSPMSCFSWGVRQRKDVALVSPRWFLFGGNGRSAAVPSLGDLGGILYLCPEELCFELMLAIRPGSDMEEKRLFAMTSLFSVNFRKGS